MEGLVFIIIIIVSIVNAANKSKKVRNNAPGKVSAPVKPAAPVRPVQQAARPTVVPTIQPTIRPTVAPAADGGQTGPFWQQVAEAMKQEKDAAKQVPGHGAAGRMPEGVSRECEHGSVGGSMAYEGHQEGRNEPRKDKRPVPIARDRQSDPEETLYRPAMNAQEMRRAVVMAEILKRPQERMAEQARRWSAR